MYTLRMLGVRADTWLQAAAPPERLAAFRILVGVFSTVYLLVRAPVVLSVRDRTPREFDALGPLWFLDSPIPDWAVVVWFCGAVVLAMAFTAGAVFRVSGPGFALALLAVTTYRSSWGQLLHFENLMVLHVLIVGFSPAADSWSLAIRRGECRQDSRYGWPLRLASLVTVLTYAIAGLAKLRLGGFGWITGETLRNHVGYTTTRLDIFGETTSPLAELFVKTTALSTPLAATTIVIELGAPLVLLLSARYRAGWVLMIWLMHVMIAGLMFIVFPYPLLLVAFAPLFDIEELPGLLRRHARGHQ
jgi:hypothetical protein